MLWVLLLANLIAMLFQALSARLGIVTGHNLAELCRDHFSRPIVWIMWVISEIAAMATNLAEFLGGAIGLSLLFLVVCLLNTIGLLLAKFLGKSGDISLRRALGASRSNLFIQHMIESGLIGLGGGVFGLGLTWLGLRGIEMLFGDFIENLVTLDWVMILTAIGLAIVSALLAGLYPTWRACRITPASQLKIN